jgi:hypothetical protein
MGFSRKLERGMPLQRASDASFCNTIREEITASHAKGTLAKLML